MITGNTSSGFSFSIDEKSLNNMEFIDALVDASDDNPAAISRVVKMLLGTEQRGRLYDHLRDEDGHVSIVAVSSEIVEILKSSGKSGKN